ncbi:hypothetical protein MMC22_011256 [Lobaria immixta]|nr:hypothetical protein [Lobaria immixta]
MIRRFPGRQALFRALSTGIPKTRYEVKDATLESGPVTPPQPTPSISQEDGSSTLPPQTGVTSPSQNSSLLHREITSIMRLAPDSLTIILSQSLTTSHKSSLLQDSELDRMASPRPQPTGLLVSSFNTVTINPTPFVSFNIKLPSRTHSAILASGSFTASGINSAALARKFLIPSEQKKSHFIKALTFTTTEGGRWLNAGQGGVWWMRCNWVREKSVQVGDHAIMVGEVVSAGMYEKRKEFKTLFYLNGSYRWCSTQDPGRNYNFSSKKEEIKGSQQIGSTQIKDQILGRKDKDISSKKEEIKGSQQIGSTQIKDQILGRKDKDISSEKEEIKGSQQIGSTQIKDQILGEGVW